MRRLRNDDDLPLVARDLELEAWIVIAAIAAAGLVCLAGFVVG